MALYMIGDVQGCADPLWQLLRKVNFSPSRDTIYLLGDLVNRGPASLEVLRQLRDWGSSAQCLLGNHDLHLLAIAHGYGRLKSMDTLDDLLAAPDRDALLTWLQARPLALDAHGWLMVHAGVFPQWSASQTLSLAKEVETVLQGPDAIAFFAQMYGNTPDHWRDDWQGIERQRCIVNALTRMRLVDDRGVMDFQIKGDASEANAPWMPWFDHPERQTQGHPIAFGHWSTLNAHQRPDVLPLDTGCVWGGCLSAARIIEGTPEVEWIKQPCPQAQSPSD
jgi:bis(5'-nucleosyl)-tetraphosphatase (symmetrical)